MSGSYPIQHLTHEEIDTTKWNSSIDTATNGLVYGYSYYLDAMAVHWDALVLNDYEAVMPLTWKMKLGIYYLYQPFLAAQLGVFGKNINAGILSAFLKAVPEKFRYWDFYLNHQNVFELNEFGIYQRSNYILDLKKPYEKLYDAYRENIKRNIKKALQLGCNVKKDFEAGLVIQLALTKIRHQGYNSREDVDHFRKLYHLLHAKQKAITYGIFSARNELMASCIFFFSHKRAYYILVGNHLNGKTIGASHALIDVFIKDHAGQQLWLDFEGSDIRNLAFFYSGFGAIEEKFAGIKLNRLPWWMKWMKK